MRLKIFSFFAIFITISIITLLSFTPKINAQSCTYTPASSNSVTSSINLTTEGNYYIWNRMMAADSASNSFFLQIDGGCAINVGDTSGISVNSFSWVNHQNADTASRILVNLTAGDHIIKITERESGVGIDKILFTNDASCIPSGIGNNCPLTVSTPTPTLTGTVIPTITASPTVTPSSLQNLVKNGGFEETGDWRKGFWAGTGTIAISNVDKKSGTYSYMIDGNSTSTSGQVYSGPINEIPVKPGDTFNYKAWYKGTNTYLVLKWFDSAGKQLLMTSFPLSNTSSWTQASVNATAPANSVETWVFVQTRNTDIPAYFDDLELYLTSGTQPTVSPTTTPAPTNTPSPTLTPTKTPSPTPANASTPTPTITPPPANSPTPTPTKTPTPPPSPTAIPPTPTPTSSSVLNGLTGIYYNNNNFTGTTKTRIDPVINFNWGSGSPINGISAYTYSVVWTGYVVPKYSQEYRFYFKTDDGARMWVNGTKLIDSWKNQSATEYSGKITLTSGQKYTIRIEYYQNWGGSTAQLRWSSSSQAKEIVPQSQLISN